MPALPKQLNKVRWFIYSAVVFFVLTEFRDLLTILIHPYNIQLLNFTGYSTNALNNTSWELAKFDIISFILTAIVIGFMATWQIRRYEKEIAQLREDTQWLSEKYKIYAPLIDEMVHAQYSYLLAQTIIINRYCLYSIHCGRNYTK